MAKVPYVPFNSDIQAVFSAFGISISTATYNGVTGWDPTAYSNAIVEVKGIMDSYTGSQYSDEQIDEWFDLLESGYTICYWSTEKAIFD